MMEKEIMEGSKNGRLWSKRRDSNPRPRDPKSRALSTALHPDINLGFSALPQISMPGPYRFL